MSDERGEALRLSFETADRERRWPNQRPHDAATLIVLDRAGARPTVLMGRRHEGHKFMPGKFVFPGGRLDRTDARMRSASELSPAVALRLAARVPVRSASRGRALALTALRETFEETGLLIGRPVETAPPLSAGSPTAWERFRTEGVAPDLAALVFLGRAITPPRRPKRFDTRFFVADRTAVRAVLDGFVGPDKELTELVWVDLEAARALDLPRITAIMLQELDGRIADGLPPDAPVPFYREERGRFLRDLL